MDMTKVRCKMDLLRIICALFSLVGKVSGDCRRDIDPCTEHEELNDPDRSTKFMIDSAAVNDFSLAEEWYRSVSAAGGDMPTEPVAMGHCNAYTPIYLIDPLPAAFDLVNLRACAITRDESCLNSYTIPVKNCGHFNVYCLGPVHDAYSRYCMGDEEECEDGMVSSTGFTPGCHAGTPFSLHLENDPRITADLIYSQHGPLCFPIYIFNCDIEHEEERAFYDVIWHANGRMVKESVGENAISYHDMPAKLTSEVLVAHGFKLGTTVSCLVRARTSRAEDAFIGNTMQTDFYAGARIHQDSMFIELQEGGRPGHYRADFTIPYGCLQLCDRIELDECGLDIDIATLSNDGDECTDNPDILVQFNQKEPDGCSVKMKANERSFSVAVRANPDHKYNPRRQIVLQLKTRSISAEPFTGNYYFPRAQIAIHDNERQWIAGAHCKVYDDPHLQAFDSNSRDEVQLAGAFILYRHRTLPILVEAYFRDRGHYSQNCGGAVRSGGDVFVFDYCRDNSPRRVTAYECSEGLTHISVQQRSSTSYEVTLPTGTKIVFDTYRMHIYPSMFDYGTTEGLCGTLNGNGADDKTIRYSNPELQDPGRRSPTWPAYMQYHEFQESWRVQDKDSLYFGKIRDDLTYGNIVFCTCSGDNEIPGAFCSSQPDVNTQCSAGSVLRNSRNQHRCALSKRRKRRNVVEDDDFDDTPNEMFPYDSSFNPSPVGWNNIWTETSAREHCETVLEQHRVVRACRSVPYVEVDAAVESCLTDIFMTGTVDFSRYQVDVLIDACQEEVSKYIFTPSNTTNTTSLPLSTDFARQIRREVCIGDCSDHGICSQGQCVCDAGYTDVDCSLDLNRVPVLYDLPRNGKCDRTVRPCEVVAVNADMFIADSVHCKVQLLDMNQHSLSDEAIYEAQYVHLQKVLCLIDHEQINRTSEPNYIVSISVSNNRVAFSEPKYLTVYEGDCWECENMTCIKKDNMCHVDGTCFGNEDAAANTPCYVCDGISGMFFIKDGFCFIDDICYNDTYINPSDTSLICNAIVSTTSWCIVSDHTPSNSNTSAYNNRLTTETTTAISPEATETILSHRSTTTKKTTQPPTTTTTTGGVTNELQTKTTDVITTSGTTTTQGTSKPTVYALNSVTSVIDPTTIKTATSDAPTDEITIVSTADIMGNASTTQTTRRFSATVEPTTNDEPTTETMTNAQHKSQTTTDTTMSSSLTEKQPHKSTIDDLSNTKTAMTSPATVTSKPTMYAINSVTATIDPTTIKTATSDAPTDEITDVSTADIMGNTRTNETTTSFSATAQPTTTDAPTTETMTNKQDRKQTTTDKPMSSSLTEKQPDKSIIGDSSNTKTAMTSSVQVTSKPTMYALNSVTSMVDPMTIKTATSDTTTEEITNVSTAYIMGKVHNNAPTTHTHITATILNDVHSTKSTTERKQAPKGVTAISDALTDDITNALTADIMSNVRTNQTTTSFSATAQLTTTDAPIAETMTNKQDKSQTTTDKTVSSSLTEKQPHKSTIDDLSNTKTAMKSPAPVTSKPTMYALNRVTATIDPTTIETATSDAPTDEITNISTADILGNVQNNAPTTHTHITATILNDVHSTKSTTEAKLEPKGVTAISDAPTNEITNVLTADIMGNEKTNQTTTSFSATAQPTTTDAPIAETMINKQDKSQTTTDKIVSSRSIEEQPNSSTNDDSSNIKTAMTSTAPVTSKPSMYALNSVTASIDPTTIKTATSDALTDEITNVSTADIMGNVQNNAPTTYTHITATILNDVHSTKSTTETKQEPKGVTAISNAPTDEITNVSTADIIGNVRTNQTTTSFSATAQPTTTDAPTTETMTNKQDKSQTTTDKTMSSSSTEKQPDTSIIDDSSNTKTAITSTAPVTSKPTVYALNSVTSTTIKTATSDAPTDEITIVSTADVMGNVSTTQTTRRFLATVEPTTTDEPTTETMTNAQDKSQTTTDQPMSSRLTEKQPHKSEIDDLSNTETVMAIDVKRQTVTNDVPITQETKIELSVTDITDVQFTDLAIIGATTKVIALIATPGDSINQPTIASSASDSPTNGKLVDIQPTVTTANDSPATNSPTTYTHITAPITNDVHSTEPTKQTSHETNEVTTKADAKFPARITKPQISEITIADAPNSQTATKTKVTTLTATTTTMKYNFPFTTTVKASTAITNDKIKQTTIDTSDVPTMKSTAIETALMTTVTNAPTTTIAKTIGSTAVTSATNEPISVKTQINELTRTTTRPNILINKITTLDEQVPFATTTSDATMKSDAKSKTQAPLIIVIVGLAVALIIGIIVTAICASRRNTRVYDVQNIQLYKV